MKIKEIMTKDVTTISADGDAFDALTLLQKMEISGLPVVDHNNKLVGMFTEKEAISYIMPSYVGNVGRFIYEENPKATKRKITQLKKMKVSELMRKDVITTTQETTLCEVAKAMIIQKVRRIPVLDEFGKLIGIVARGDVLKGFTQEAETA